MWVWGSLECRWRPEIVARKLQHPFICTRLPCGVPKLQQHTSLTQRGSCRSKLMKRNFPGPGRDIDPYYRERQTPYKKKKAKTSHYLQAFVKTFKVPLEQLMKKYSTVV